ncbi:Protein translocase subunit SecD [Azospirillaceae bacterium]
MLYFSKWKIYAIIAVCAASVLFSLPNLISRQLLERAPDWLPHRQVNLGLDLRGGSYLLLEVDMATVLKERLDHLQDSVRTELRAGNVGYTGISEDSRAVRVQVRDSAQAQDVVRLLRTKLATNVGGGPLGGGRPDINVDVGVDGAVILQLSEDAIKEKLQRSVEQSIEIVRRRIDETGVNEPSIARQGEGRILVQLPGVTDPDRIKRLLGQTAKMTFRLVDVNADPSTGRVPSGAELLPSVESDRRGGSGRYVVKRRVEVDGANLVNARAGNNPQTGEWVVNFEFDAVGARRFADITKANVNRPFAIVLDNKVISAPVIREPITGGRGQISGSFNAQSANDLAVLLRAGALPAPLIVIEERSVGPDLGADAINAGIYSCLVGFTLVVSYMVAAYGLFGVFANIALLFNLFLTVAILSLMQATLTLPGIAGILLTLGMSVDANILINERIREETRKGKTPYSAMEAGFKRAFSTIFDANITTLIKMLILFSLGSGSIKGFAVSISIGIMTSMFTAVVLARLMMVTWLRRVKPVALQV